jgi:hypothetical protein
MIIEAFGLRVRLPRRLAGSACRPADSAATITTTVTVNADACHAWDVTGRQRVREIRDADRVFLSVDLNRNDEYFVRAPGVASIFVSTDGTAVHCAPEGDDSGCSALLFSQALPLVATLQGLEVFHASGVTLRGAAHVFCGQPGAGKSSLAAHLALRGAEVLSDDAVAIDDDLVAHPGAGGVHLRQGELERLGPGQAEALSVEGTRLDGRAVARLYPAAPAPVQALYMLARASAGPLIEPVRAFSPAWVLGSTYNLSVKSSQRLRRHLDLCARINDDVGTFRVRVIPGVDAANLAEALIRIFEGQAAAEESRDASS